MHQILFANADPDANIIFGATINEEMGSKIKISVIATGFDEKHLKFTTGNRPYFGAYSKDSSQRAAQTNVIGNETCDWPCTIWFCQPTTTNQLTQSRSDQTDGQSGTDVSEPPEVIKPSAPDLRTISLTIFEIQHFSETINQSKFPLNFR